MDVHGLNFDTSHAVSAPASCVVILSLIIWVIKVHVINKENKFLNWLVTVQDVLMTEM